MYVFDKDGEWHDEGIYHDSLNMEATYNETQWYDEFNPHNFMWAIQSASFINQEVAAACTLIFKTN